MNPQMIITMLSKFFPNNNISGAIQQGQQMIKGVENSKAGVVDFIQSKGITNTQIDKVCEYIRTNPLTNTICKTMGVNPISVINDIKSLKSDSNNNNPDLAPKLVKPQVNGTRKFTKL